MFFDKGIIFLDDLQFDVDNISSYEFMKQKGVIATETGRFAPRTFRPRSFRPNLKSFHPNPKSFRPSLKSFRPNF